MKEDKLHAQICDYIKLQYPKVLFNTDMSGIKLTMGQAKKAAKLRSGRGFPDIMVFEPKMEYHGLFLEVKTECPFRKDGMLKKMKRYETINGIKVEYDHLEEQFELILDLKKRGYSAGFVWTFEMAKNTIDYYLTDSPKPLTNDF